jgi:tight adherence protein B
MFLAAISFALVFSATLGAYSMLQQRQRRREARLLSRVGAWQRVAEEKQARKAPMLIEQASAQGFRGLGAWLPKLFNQESLRRKLERAGKPADPASTLRACALCAAVAGIGSLFLLSGIGCLAAIPVALAFGYLPLWNLGRKVRKRLHKFEGQFPDGLEFIARSMRAGHAFSVALEMLHREFDDPMAGEFRRTFEEQNLGMPLDMALGKLAERIPLLDVKFFASAVQLQRKTGGNLTEILDKLALLIRERYQLRGKIRAVSAHGRMTGKALSSIPVFVGVLMCIVNKEYAAFFSQTLDGRLMIGGAVVLQIIGYLVIQKIVVIEI